MSEIAHSFSLAGPNQKPSKQEQDRESGRPKTKALTKFAQVGATYWPSYSILQNIVSIKPETRMAASEEGILNLSLLCIFPAAVLIQGVPKKRTNKTNKNGQTWQPCQHSKVVQNGRNGQPICF